MRKRGLNDTRRSTGPLKFLEKGGLQLAIAVIISVERFEDFVQALEEKGPKPMERAKIPSAVGYVSCVVVVWFDDRGTV